MAAEGNADSLAYACYEEALHTARAIEALPWVLSAAVGIAALSAKAGRYGPVVEMLTLAVYHPACNQRTRERSARLLSRLEAELPAEAVAGAEERGRHKQLDDAIQDLLGLRLPVPAAAEPGQS
jgi:hypothetical protein